MLQMRECCQNSSSSLEEIYVLKPPLWKKILDCDLKCLPYCGHRWWFLMIEFISWYRHNSSFPLSNCPYTKAPNPSLQHDFMSPQQLLLQSILFTVIVQENHTGAKYEQKLCANSSMNSVARSAWHPKVVQKTRRNSRPSLINWSRTRNI